MKKSELFAMVDCEVKDLNTRAKWLEFRQKTESVGASETPMLFGCGGKGKSQYWLWGRKIDPAIVEEDAQDEAETASWGNTMEAPILERWGKKLEPVVTVHPWPQTAVCLAEDFAGFCTPDAIAVDDRGKLIAEVKAWDEASAWLWADGVPNSVLVQVQQQMRITGIHRAVVIVLFGNKINKLRTYDIDYDPDFGLDIEQRCNRFAQYVIDQEAPPVDESEGTYETIQRLHPDDNGETADLPEEFETFAAQWHFLKAQEKETEERLQALKNKICAAIGDSTFGETPSGAVWKWKTQSQMRVDTKKLRAKYPDAAEACEYESSHRRLYPPAKPKGDA